MCPPRQPTPFLCRKQPPTRKQAAMPADLTPFTGVLPYASELYGMYQSLIGWRSRRTTERIHNGFRQFQAEFVERLPFLLQPDVEIRPVDRGQRELEFRVHTAT